MAPESGTPRAGWAEVPMRGPGDILRVASRRYGDKTALITAGRSFGYAELDDLAAQAAAGLRAAGVQPGQVVSLYGPNSWQWVLAYHAILRAGAVVNPINVMLTPPEVAFILRDCGSVAMLASQAQLPVLSELAGGIETVRFVRGLDSDGEDGFAALFGTPPLASPPAIDPAGLSTIGYTSGTTGHPKGAMQSHRAVLVNCALTATMHGRADRDVVVTALPAPHVYGNVVINGTFLAGGTVVLMQRFLPAEALALIGEHRATMFEGCRPGTP